MAEQDNSNASSKYQEVHKQWAAKHTQKIGDKVLIDNQLFVAKNKKFAPMWIGTFVITKNINEQKVDVIIKKISIYNVCRLKKFMDPDKSKFKDEGIIKVSKSIMWNKKRQFE